MPFSLLLLGVVAFLGFAHADATILEGNAYLRYEASPEASAADGLVLGEAYAGPLTPGYTLTAVRVGGTLLHRFAEGALIAAPAIMASVKPTRWLPLLLVGLLTIPSPYVPDAIHSGTPTAGAVALDQGVSVFMAGVEAGFAGLLLFLALIPRVAAAKDGRWAVWAGLAFTTMLLIHFLVE